MFAILNLIHWSRSNSNGYCALSLSGLVRYSPRRIRLVGANTFFALYLNLLHLLVPGCGNTDIIRFFKAALARVSALIAAQREPKPPRAKKIRGKKSKVASEWTSLHLLSSQLPYGSMHTSNILMVSINLLLTLSDEFLIFYVKKAALTIVHFFFDYVIQLQNAKPIILQTPNALPAGCPILTPIVWPLFPPFRSLVGRVVSVFQWAHSWTLYFLSFLGGNSSWLRWTSCCWVASSTVGAAGLG